MLEKGQTASISKVITEEDVENFGEISLDYNPVHFNDERARAFGLKSRIAHGLISVSLFSGLMGTKMPGNGTVWMDLHVRFLKPVAIGEEVTATVVIDEVRPDKPIITLKHYVKNEAGEMVIDGESVVKVPPEVAYGKAA
jgi:acyl dehydratase